jgi:nucleoside 2-deoxyribosyltransferase
MPISTPEHLVPKYSGDKDHFFHVLEHLFVPAVERNKFNAVRPIAEGSDVIHAEIIKNLEKADLVLCDASSLNANVFYELGIRTALDKPVCIVRDELTPKIPFDTTIINHHVYESSLTFPSDINSLASCHLKSRC